MKNWQLLTAVMMFIFSAGCSLPIGLPIPMPEHSGSHTSRSPIKEERLEFVEVGSTKKEEILLNLGDPNIVSEEQRVFEYMWMTKTGFWTSGVLMQEGTFNHFLGELWFSHWYTLRIDFDEDGIVTSYSIEKE